MKIIQDVFYFNLAKGLYKLHQQLDIPPIIEYFLDKLVIPIKNNTLLVSFNKSFFVETHIIYLNKKLEDILKDKITLYLLGKFIQIAQNIVEDKIINQMSNVISKVGVKKVMLSQKKVMGELVYFITKEKIFSEKIVGFYLFRNGKQKIYYEPKESKDIRALRNQTNESIYTIDLYKILSFIKQIKQKAIVKNILFYYVLTDSLEKIKNEEQKKEILAKIFLAYQILPEDIQRKFIIEDKIIKENLKTVLENYFTILLNSFVKI